MGGEVICREDDPPGPTYVVLSGRLRVYRRDLKNPPHVQQLAELGAGAVFGELASILEQPRSATVQAITACELLELPPGRLQTLAREHPGLQRVLSVALEERAGLSADQIAILTVQPGADDVSADSAASAVLPVPAHNPELLYPKPLSCPVCRTQFSALVFRPHKDQPAARSTDFHQTYRSAPNPYDYEVWVCPTDLYAAFPSDFAELAPAYRERVPQTVAELVTQEWAGQRPTFNVDRSLELREQSLQLAFAIYRLRRAPPLRLASVLHRLGWCARERGDEERERHWLAEALHAYTRGFHEADLGGPKGEIRVQYLCGEIARRLGDHQTAAMWLSQLLRHTALKRFPMFERLTRDQWAAVREALSLGSQPPSPPAG